MKKIFKLGVWGTTHKGAIMAVLFGATMVLSSIPAFATTPTASIQLNPIDQGGSSAVATAANNILGVLDQFGLIYLQVGVAIAIAIITLIAVIKASKDKNTKAMGTELAFAIVGIVLVLNPILLISAALNIGSWISGGSSTTTGG
jgi:hypothetical protein